MIEHHVVQHRGFSYTALSGEWPTVHALTSGGIFSGLLGTVSTILTGLCS